jgi:hypothetical protein
MTDVVGPHNPHCGAWQNGVWTPNGNCVEETTTTTTTRTTRPSDTGPAAPMAADPERGDRERPGRVMQGLRGTITAVNGHLVTLEQSTRTLVVDDSPALARQDSGRVAVGRRVTMHGYWEGDTFYVTRFE